LALEQVLLPLAKELEHHPSVMVLEHLPSATVRVRHPLVMVRVRIHLESEHLTLAMELVQVHRRE